MHENPSQKNKKTKQNYVKEPLLQENTQSDRKYQRNETIITETERNTHSVHCSIFRKIVLSLNYKALQRQQACHCTGKTARFWWHS